MEFNQYSGEIEVLSPQAQNMIAALYKGMMPTFKARNWLGTGENVRVGLSAANFQPAFESYSGCVAGLLRKLPPDCPYCGAVPFSHLALV